MSGTDLADLVERAVGLVEQATVGSRVVLGLAGAPGSGKTTLSAALVEGLADRGLPAEVVPMDGFHLADVALDGLGLRDRKGTPETFDATGYAALVHRLRAVEDLTWAPGFDRDLEQPLAGALGVPRSCRLVVTEGNYLLLPDGAWAAARSAMAEVWFLAVPEALRRERLLSRHVRFGKAPEEAARWIAAVDDPNAALVERHREKADLQIDLDADLASTAPGGRQG